MQTSLVKPLPSWSQNFVLHRLGVELDEGWSSKTQAKCRASELCPESSLDKPNPEREREREGLSCLKEGCSESLHPLSGLANEASRLEAGPETFPAETEAEHTELSTQVGTQVPEASKEEPEGINLAKLIFFLN